MDGLIDYKKYSTEEYFTGRYWIDSKPIYERCLTGLTYGDIDVTSWNIDSPIRIYGYGIYSGDNTYQTLPAFGTGSEVHSRLLSKTTLTYKNSFSYGWSDYVVCEYTKTTD